MKILLVDDDPRALERLRVLLAPAHELRVAEHAEAALVVIAGVDAVISDYAMPGMNGLELLQRVHIQFPRVRRVLCSSAPPAVSEELVRKGMLAAVLKKPATLQQLNRALGILQTD